MPSLTTCSKDTANWELSWCRTKVQLFTYKRHPIIWQVKGCLFWQFGTMLTCVILALYCILVKPKNFLMLLPCGSMPVDNYIDYYLAVRAYNPPDTCHSWTPDPGRKEGWIMRLTSNYVCMANHIMQHSPTMKGSILSQILTLDTHVMSYYCRGNYIAHSTVMNR